MIKSQTSLPAGWRLSTLGEECEWGSGGTPKSTITEYYDGDIPWAIIGDLNDGIVRSTRRSITQSGLDNSSAKIVDKGSILIAMYGSIGKLGIAGTQLATNQAIAFTKSVSTNPKYLFWYLMSIRNDLISMGKGGTQSNISQTVLKAVPFPIAPPDEQKAIVDEIETQIARLDDAEAALRRAEVRLRKLRRSVSAMIVSEAKQYLDLANLAQSRLGEIAADVRYGTSQKASESGDIPVLRMGNIVNGTIDYEKLKYISSGQLDSDKLLLEPGDLLFNRTNSAELVGKSAVYEGKPNKYTFASYLIKASFDDSTIAKFTALFINSPEGREWIASVVSQQVGQANVNGTKLKALMVPLPPIPVARGLVEKAEEQFVLIDQLGRQINSTDIRLNALRQAILKNAFEGNYGQ